MIKHILPRIIAVFLAIFIVGYFVPDNLPSPGESASGGDYIVGLFLNVFFVIVVGGIYTIFGMKFRQGVMESILGIVIILIIIYSG